MEGWLTSLAIAENRGMKGSPTSECEYPLRVLGILRKSRGGGCLSRLGPRRPPAETTDIAEIQY